MNRFGVFVVALVAIAVLTAATNLNQYSLQQALNMLAGNTSAPYTRYSAQQAANVLVNRQISEQDSMIATVVFVIDDNSKEWWGDSVFVNPAPSQIKKTIRQLMKESHLVAGLSTEPHAILYGDSSLTLTKAKITQLCNNYGWECGTVGYNEPASLYNGNYGKIATGAYTKGMAAFEYDIRRGYEACRDSLGFTPRWISWSNSSCAQVLKEFAARYYEFGFQPSQTATVGSGDGTRPNELYTVNAARYGAWGTGGAGSYPMSAVPGLLPDRYELIQSLGEGNDSTTTYKTFRRAMQTRGMVTWIGHKASIWETSLGAAQNDFASVCLYLKTKIEQGRIRCLTPAQAADLYVNAPMSSSMNYSTDNFQDYDKDGHLDWWFSGRGHQFAITDTALLKPSALSGHGGKQAMSLNWNGMGSKTGEWAGQTSNASWETTRAQLCVIPPAGGGWTVQFECFLICDTTVAGWNAGTAPQAGDTVGVTFAGPMESYSYRYGTGVPLLMWLTDSVGNYNPLVSHPIYASASAPPFFKFTARNNVHRTGKEWLHLVAAWDVPEISDYVWISLWKAGNVSGGTNPSPPNGILMSDYSVTFHKRFQNYNGQSLTRQ